MANIVSRQSRYKKLVMFLTIHERLPFLGMAAIAWFSPRLSPGFILFGTFLMLAWQGFGAGFTANPWQSMVAKIIPPRQRGTFFGLQGSAINVFLSIGAIISGFILERLGSPLDFTLCFLIACVLLVASYIAIGLTKEEPAAPHRTDMDQKAFLTNLQTILKKDANFVWFLIARIMTHFAAMASAFYIVYAVRHFQISEGLAGIMASVLAGSSIVANPVLGWLGDRLGHRLMLAAGALAAALSAVVAILAPGPNWFFLVFILLGISNVASWTIAMSITLEFGTEVDRSVYIGLANTLIAPGALIAPLLGGWIADQAGYSTTFMVSAVCGVITFFIILLFFKDPRHLTPAGSMPHPDNGPGQGVLQV
jgi:MFS family permease